MQGPQINQMNRRFPLKQFLPRLNTNSSFLETVQEKLFYYNICKRKLMKTIIQNTQVHRLFSHAIIRKNVA